MSENTNLTPNANASRSKLLRGRREKILIALAALMLVGYFTATPAAVFVIEMYQKHISPYNHHRCPYGLLHGGETCSQYGKDAIQQHGLLRGLWMLHGRFDECHDAQLVLQKNPKVVQAGFCCYSCGDDDDVHSCEW